MFKKRFISMLVLLMVAATGAWATITVTWNNDDITGSGNSFTKDGVTITAGEINFWNKDFMSGGTFTTDLGNFTKIEVTTGDCYVSGTGWSFSGPSGTWTGNASSVPFSGYFMGMGLGNTKFVFTIEPPTVAVTGITLDKTEASMIVGGETLTLTATVAPDDAMDKTVTWTTSDASVATVADGVVTAVAVGTATITATSNADATKTATCAVTAKHGTYAVAMKAGVTDGDKWTARAGGSGDFAAMPLKGVEGGTKPVELKYGGDLEVKRVTMRVVPTWKGDLSKLSATELESDGVTVLVADGMTLTGTLSENYKITIADGATVTLDGVTVSGVNDANCQWAGITCLGDATIVLKDGSVNAVTGFQENYPGICVPVGKTLTIDGPGKLTASSNGKGAGIGGGKNLGCGNIVIAATVGYVKAMKGTDAPYSIGAGDESTCGTVTIGGTVYYDGSDYQNDGATYLAQATIEYPTPAYTLLSAATTEDVGKVVCAAGHLHDAKTAVPTGCTAVGIVGKVTATGHGLILALQDATTQGWDNINGWTTVYSYAGTTLKVLPDDAARGTNLTSYTTLGETTVSNWAVGQKSDYDAIFQNLGSTAGNVNGKTYDGHVNAYITTGVGGTAMSGDYWSATNDDGSDAWCFDNGYWDDDKSTYNSCSVRPVLGFGEEALPALNITSPSVGQVIGRDGKNYAYGSLPTGVTAWAKICYVSGSNGLALALTDEGQMDWSTAQTTCAAHTAPFTGGTWKLATKDEWDNMISAAGSYTALRDGFSSVGGTDMLSVYYWSSTEYDSDSAWYYRFGYGDWKYNSKNSTFGYLARACLEF